MLLEIDHHSGLPIYRQVIEQIRRQIMSGQLPPGRQLDSVRNLAQRLKINPMTVSKAYAYMEMEGLLERRRGVGLFVAQLQEDQKEPKKLAMLAEILQKAAMTATQLDIPPDKATQMFDQLCQECKTKMRRQE